MGNKDPSKQDASSGGDRAWDPERDLERKMIDASGAFVQLLATHQHRIRAYLMAVVGSDQEADDLLQETNMVLWNKRDVYDHARPFFSWACGIAYIEVMRSRRRLSAEKLRFDAALLESVSDEFIRQGDLLDDRQESLRHCLDQLNPDERRLIKARYHEEWSVEKLAAATGKPTKTIYGSLARIREALFRCIERTVAQNQRPRLS